MSAFLFILELVLALAQEEDFPIGGLTKSAFAPAQGTLCKTKCVKLPVLFDTLS